MAQLNEDYPQSVTCCFTGHRPDFFPWGRDERSEEFTIFRGRLSDAVDGAIRKGARRFVCGNALGFDTWAAEVVLEKKREWQDIVLEIAVPFEGHNENSTRVKRVQRDADWVHVVSDARSHRDAFLERNDYMVEESAMLIAAYDPNLSKPGGTTKTYKYAERLGRDITLVQFDDLI